MAPRRPPLLDDGQTTATIFARIAAKVRVDPETGGPRWIGAYVQDAEWATSGDSDWPSWVAPTVARGICPLRWGTRQ